MRKWLKHLFRYRKGERLVEERKAAYEYLEEKQQSEIEREELRSYRDFKFMLDTAHAGEVVDLEYGKLTITICIQEIRQTNLRKIKVQYGQPKLPKDELLICSQGHHTINRSELVNGLCPHCNAVPQDYRTGKKVA